MTSVREEWNLQYAFRVKDTAKSIGVTQRTIYNWIKAGRLKTVKVGGCRLIPAAEIRSLIESKLP